MTDTTKYQAVMLPKADHHLLKEEAERRGMQIREILSYAIQALVEKKI